MKFPHPQQGKAQEIEKKGYGNTQHHSIKRENAYATQINQRIGAEIEYGVHAEKKHANFGGTDFAVRNFIYSGYSGVDIR